MLRGLRPRPWVILAAAIVASGPTAASAAPLLQQISPTPTNYVLGVDFNVLEFSAVTDVTALVQAVAIGDATPGCEAADFAGFTPGRIALLSRGVCFFEDKAENAAAAGAVGILVFNNFPGLFAGTLQETFTGGIPAFALTQELGQALLAVTGQLTIRMFNDIVPTVPAPPTALLVTSGLVAMARRLRRRVGSR